jgi:glycosyltransferase involved in cell wall biosynthesis
MKFLHVIASMNACGGGPCQGIRSFAPWFNELGHAFEVVCLDDPNSGFLSLEKFPVHALGQGRGAWSYHSKLLPWLNDNLPRFDAAILNGLWQYPGHALSKASRHPRMPPYFIFPHGMLDPWFQRAPERRMKAIRNWLYWKVIENRVVCDASALLFTCAEEMRLAQKTFRPYQPKREINVGFGIPQPPEYHIGMKATFVEKCPGMNGRPFFLFLGRIHPKKGVDILIQAFSAICRPSLPKLVIAGPGCETAFGKKMQALASKICPPDSVFWPGMLTGDAKWGALYNAEAFALTSHQENFGIAVVEALACGLPVLISNQVNIWREIERDKAGLTGDDTREGAEQLFRRWASLPPQDKAAMKRAAKSSFENRFDIARAAKNLLTALEEVTMRPRRPEKISKNGIEIPG